MLKVSRYFLLYDDVSPAVAINTATGGSYTFDPRGLAALKDVLRNPGKDGQLRDFLLEEHVLIEEDVDELQALKDRHRAGRASREELYITYSLTNSCNFRCTYCYQEHDEKSITEDSLEKTFKFVEKTLPLYGRLKVHWFGGEPMLQMRAIVAASDRLRTIARQQDKGYYAGITTNGSLFTETNARRLKEECGVTQVQFTIDGAPDNHNQLRILRSGKGTYEIVARAIERAVQYDFLVFVRINLSPTNVRGIELVLQDFTSRGLGPHNIRLYINEMKQHASSSPDASLYFPSIKDYGASLISCLRLMSSYGYPLPAVQPVDVNCAFDKPSSVLFGTDGDLYHCTTGTDRALALLSAEGDIATESERRKWVHSREPWDDPMCASCSYLPTCMGGCAYLDESGKTKCNPEGFILEDLLRLSLEVKTQKEGARNG